MSAKGVVSMAYPHQWSVELVRNGAGRAFFFVSRFIARTEVEYVTDVAGTPVCYRNRAKAEHVAWQRNLEGAQQAPEPDASGVTITQGAILW